MGAGAWNLSILPLFIHGWVAGARARTPCGCMAGRTASKTVSHTVAMQMRGEEGKARAWRVRRAPKWLTRPRLCGGEGESGGLSLRVGVTMLRAQVNWWGHMAVTAWTRRERRGEGMAMPGAHTAPLISSRDSSVKLTLHIYITFIGARKLWVHLVGRSSPYFSACATHILHTRKDI
jgi:hypothetical protein